MSQQINFSDLSDAQKESYFKYIIDNGIPLQQDDQSPQDFLVANISLPQVIKQINSSYDSSIQQINNIEPSLKQQKRTIENNTNSNNKNNENENRQRDSSSPHQRKDSKSPQIVLRENIQKNNYINNAKKNIPIVKKASHFRANSMQDCKLEKMMSSQLKQLPGNIDQSEDVQVRQQENKVSETSFTFSSGKQLNTKYQSKKHLPGKENKLNEFSQDSFSTNKQTKTIKADRNNNNNNQKLTLPSFDNQQNQKISKNNILIIETESHTESTNSTEGKDHTSNKPNMKEIYSILRSVGFSPKLLLSECGEDDHQSSISGEMRSDPTDLPPKREENSTIINMNLKNNNVQNLKTTKFIPQNDRHVNRSIVSNVTPNKAERPKEKDQPCSQNYLSHFTSNSKNPKEYQSLSENKTQKRNISPFSSQSKKLAPTTLSQAYSPSKTNKSSFSLNKIQKVTPEQNKLKTKNVQDKKDENLNQDKISDHLDHCKSHVRQLSYEKTPKKLAQRQVTQDQDGIGQSLERIETQNKRSIMSAKQNKQYSQKSPSKSGAKSNMLFNSFGLSNFPNIRRLFRQKAGKISRTPIGQTKSIMAEIFYLRAGNGRFRGMFREFVYDYFLNKYKSSANNAESSLANFLASLEFHSETSPAAQQFLEIMENNDDEQLKFLISAMQELQTHFKEINVLSVRITEKQLPMLFELILGETAKPFQDKFLEGIFQIDEYQTQQTISAQEFLAIFGLFRSTPEFIALNSNIKDHESRRCSGQMFQMINESFGQIQECISSRRDTIQQDKQQELIQSHNKITQDTYSSHSKPAIKFNTSFSSSATSANNHSRQSNTLSSLNTVKKLFDEKDNQFDQNDNNDDDDKLKQKSFLSILYDEMDQMVHEFIIMFEIKSFSSTQKLHGLISKKCRQLITALGSRDQNKWFELMTISNPNYQQMMQAETTQKLFEAYEKSYCNDSKKDLTNIRQLCRIILKIPELSEAISKLLICVLVPEE